MHAIRKYCEYTATLFLITLTIGVSATEIYKADNDLALNDPLSWEGGALPGPDDLAVFDERATTNRLNFVLTGNLEIRGLMVTNSTAIQVPSAQTMVISTNGTDSGTLSIGTDGVNLSNSGTALSWKLPVMLTEDQTWQAARNHLTFSDQVSGSVDWTMAGTSGIVWNVASCYNGKLAMPNAAAPSVCRFYQSGQIAKTFSLSGPNDGTRIELAFTGTALWSSLFADRFASVTNSLFTVTSGATLQFAADDIFAFPGGRFVLDNGNAIQNGGNLNGKDLQVGYKDYNCLYTFNDGDLSLSRFLVLGYGLTSLRTTQMFRQNGGIVDTPTVATGYDAGKYLALTTYEMNGGTLHAGKPKTADTGIRMSWNQNGVASQAPGAFLMNNGTVHADSIAFGRYGNNTSDGVTNTYSLFKMKGGELYLGRNGIYTDRTWNNGPAGAGYGVKLSGGVLAANDNWSSSADLLLSDLNGGIAIKAENPNGVAKTILLNGSVYGSGGLTKQGSGALVLAGRTAYRGVTKVEEGTLVIQPRDIASYRWTADSLELTNNAPVISWQDIHQNVPAANVVARAPVLIKKELNGHNVVRFTSAKSTSLVVAGENSPIGGATSFTIALVFKTGSAGVSISASDQWYRHTGLIDSEQPDKQNDWGMSYNPAGQIAAGAGDLASKSDKTVYSQSGYSVSDSQPHVAIYTWRGTNITINLDGRAVTAPTQAASVVPRNLYPMLFGSLANEADKYFNGDIAEVRIYRNRAFTPEQQALLGMELAANYGVANAVFEVPASVDPITAEAPVFAANTPDNPLPYPVEVWDAATVAGTHNSDVTSWTATGGVKTASLAAATVNVAGGTEVEITGRTAPKLAHNAINGRPALRFTASQKSVLGIPSSDNPLAGCTNFTVAMIIRTATAGSAVYADDANWHRYSGLLDAEEPSAQNDWGLSWSNIGRINAGFGNPDTTLHSKPFDLHDGEPHVLVVAYDISGGKIVMTVDGLDTWKTIAGYTTPRNIQRLLLGSINGVDGKYFTGDIAEFHLYPERVLTAAEMTGLSQSLMSKYGIHAIATGNTVVPEGSATLSSSGFEISSGASLVFPHSDVSPYTLTHGQTLSGAGTVRGTIAFGSGGTIDVGQSSALSLDDLRLLDGSSVYWNHENGIGRMLTVNTLTASGTVAIQVSGGQNLLARAPVIVYSEGNGLETTTWLVVGGKANSKVEINTTSMTVDLVTPMGTRIIIR